MLEKLFLSKFSKIKFLWQAKNAHGLHSPFVFDFYSSIKKKSKRVKLPIEKSKIFNKKESRILLAMIQHIKPVNALVLSNEEQIESNWFIKCLHESNVFFAQSISILPKTPSRFDLIILSNPLIINSKEQYGKLFSIISNQSVVIIPHIHASKDSIKQWEFLIKEKSVSVSMDLFFIGLLFFRKESTKQDFKLRF